MFAHLIFLLTIISSYYILSKQSADIPNIIMENNVKSPKYTNLREWLSQLVINIPNDLVQDMAQGLVEDLTIYGIGLDNIITTNPEILENTVGLNISMANACINIRGLFALFSLDKTFSAHISNLNIQLPLYLIRDPVYGLVTEVDTNGLNIDFNNLVIEIELNIPDILRDILMAILREVLLSLKSNVIEPSLASFLNKEIGGLFQKVNDIIQNGVEPKPLNITIKEEDISDLKKSSLISAVGYLLNHLTGADGPLSLNNLVDIITYDTGVLRLHEFYNKSINIEFDLIDKENNSYGNYEVSLDDLNISGFNTWKNFSVLEPYNKILLRSYTDLQNLTINISFSLKITLDNATNFSANKTILYERANLRTNLVNNTLKGFLQLPIDDKKPKSYSNKECLNLDCILDLADANGTGINSLSLNETFTYIILEFDKQSSLEEDLDNVIDKIIKLFISSFDDKISLLINALLNKTAIDFVNEKINDYLYKNYCPGISDPDDSEINKTNTIIAFSAAFAIFIMLILFPYFLGNSCKKDSNKAEELIESNEANERIASDLKNGKNFIEPKYCFPGITIGWLKEMGRIDASGASLFLHPQIPIFWRIFIPLGIFATIALFISSNSSTGASVFVVFQVGRRIQIPSLFDFGLINSVRDMWKAGVYPLSVIVALFSGIWPYVKLVLMIISFVLPTSLLKKKKRSSILLILDATGKCSILDSYIMILMLVAFHFHIPFPVVPPSEAKQETIIDVFVYAAYGFFTLILGTIISLFLSHVITQLNRSLEEHPDQNKGKKAESYKALISFAENKYFGKIFFRILITILLFGTLILVLVGINITSFSFHFHGLAGYALELFKISPIREYSVIELGLDVPRSYENPNDGVIRFTQFIYFLTVFVIPVALLINIIFLWLVPLPRKTQKLFYIIAEILNAWSCLDVFVLSIIAAIVEIGQFTEFIVGDKCDAINPFIAKYFYKVIDGHNTCFEVKAYLKSGCWLLFAATIIFLISSNIVMKVCRNSLNERLPDHVKEYLKNKFDDDSIFDSSSVSLVSVDTNRETCNKSNNDERVSNINNTRISNSNF